MKKGGVREKRGVDLQEKREENLFIRKERDKEFIWLDLLEKERVCERERKRERERVRERERDLFIWGKRRN